MSRARSLTAVLAVAALALSPLITASPAQAAPGDIVGEVIDGAAWPDGTLAQFVEGEAYSDQLRAPFELDDRYHDPGWEVGGDFPAGLTPTLVGLDRLSITGTPSSAADFEFTVSWYGTEGDFAQIRFTGTVESTKIATTPTLDVTSPVTPYGGISVEVAVPGDGVSGTPTGTVEIWTDPATFGRSEMLLVGPLAGGAFSGMLAIPISDVGGSRGFLVKYLGDGVYAPSTSAIAATMPYIPAASGEVRLNGLPVEGATVRLLDAASPSSGAIVSMTTGADGAFELEPAAPTISTVSDAFVVEAELPSGDLIYYNAALDPGVADVALASSVSRLSWTDPLDIIQEVLPVWSETALATPRIGSAYSDSVTATSPDAVTYTVSAGSVPSGLTLNPDGTLTGTPSCADEPCTYSFTIRAANSVGAITQPYSGTLLPAGVPPTWTDDVLPTDLQVGTAVSDAVAATGDPTITYAVTTGTLPPGLDLSTSTGAVTGTPTTSGDYSFTISASNEFGTITADFDVTVAAAPELDLVLNFAAGTRVGDATTDISADGLRVGSTYTLTMHSKPVVLYTGTIGATGGFGHRVSIPANTPPGPHELILQGVAPDGTIMTARAWFVLLPNGRIGGISYVGPFGALALTGAEPGPVLGLAGLLIAGGVVALGLRRRIVSHGR